MIRLLACLAQPDPPTPGWPTHDFDGDGWSELEGDCADHDPALHPGAEEVCDDGLDNNCDGRADPCGLWGEVGEQDADRSWYGESGSALAGHAVSAADGLVLVGAPGADDEVGRVYALRAADPSGPIDPLPSWVGEAPGDWFGVGVAWTSDLDGDGDPDLVVGATGGPPDGDPNTPGSVYVLDREPGSAPTARVLGVGGAVLGERLAAGDLDGDGQDDLLVGGARDDGVATDAGAAWLLRGPLVGDLVVDEAALRVQGVAADEGLGESVLAADVDGDGVTEALVGAPGAQLGGGAPGAVLVLAGSGTGILAGADADVVLAGAEDGDAVGASLAAADIDGDGLVDVVIGSPGEQDEARGAVVVASGPVTADLELDHAELRVVGEAPDDDLGDQVSAPGDVDGDGAADLWLSSTEHRDSAEALGVAYLVLGGCSGLLAVGEAAAARVAYSGAADFGEGLAGAELTGDGHVDLVVTAPLAGPGQPRGGAVHVFFGGAP